jgi:hypothetical protein
VIDISGDGRNNRGRSAPEARDDAVRAGVTINGLPILAIELDLEDFYRDNVIGGPGAFVIPAASFETFAEAVLKKLVIEISDAEAVGPPSPRVSPTDPLARSARGQGRPRTPEQAAALTLTLAP